jgi:hypothetical protein
MYAKYKEGKMTQDLDEQIESMYPFEKHRHPKVKPDIPTIAYLTGV